MTKTSNSKLALAVTLIAAAVVLAGVAFSNRSAAPALTYSQFLNDVRSSQVATVVLEHGPIHATGRLKNGSPFRTVLPPDYLDALSAMQSQLVSVETLDTSASPGRVFVNSIPFLLLLGVWIVIMVRKLRGARPRQLGSI
jgi:cell division protease FtsH